MTNGEPYADEKPGSTRAFIDLCNEHPGLAGTLNPLILRESPLMEDLRDAMLGASPAEVSTQIDAQLRAIIRAAQQARKLLKSEAA